MRQLLFKRKSRFILYFIACFIPVVNDLIRAGILALLFQAIQLKDMDFFVRCIIIAIISIVVMAILFILSRMMRISYMRDTILDVRIAAFDKILNSSHKQFSQKSKDVYISNLVNDINNFEKNFFLNLLNVIYRAGIYLASLLIIFFIKPYLGLAVFLVSFIMFFLVRAFEKKTVSLQKQLSEENEQFTVNMSNTFNGLEILKINNIEDRFIAKNIDEIDKVERNKFHFRFFTESQRNVTNIMGYISFIGILIYLLTEVENGLNYGMVMLLVQLANNVTFTLPDIFPRINVIRSSEDIYKKITSSVEDNDDFSRFCSFRFEKSIDVKNLSFSYDDKVIFKEASCTIEKGKKYLIRGVSGIGKSTLIKILSMTYENYEGDITVDGIDLKNIKEKDFNDKVAFIYQDVFLFEDTIQNNITLYKPLKTEDLKKAITKAGLDDFISTKEKGTEELVAENGKNLSGGERQRISIARAIAKKAEILFIDEGTSALNEDLGKEIEKAFLSLDATVLSISHRYYEGVSDQYDYVLEIKDGKIKTYDAKTYFTEVTYA